MKTTIMEYGLIIVTITLGIFFLAGFQLLIGDDGNLKNFILQYISNIC